MNKKQITTSILTLSILAAAAALPVSASAKCNENNGLGFGFGIFTQNNGQNKEAKTAYQKALKDAETAYKNARQAAKDKLKTSLSSAGSDFTKKMEAYKTYLSEIMAAMNQKNSARMSAMQTYINSLSSSTPPQTNQAPTANSQTVTLAENTAKAIALTGSDPENATLSYTVVSNPSHGTLTGTAPNLNYTPSTNYYGSDSFTFRVSDGTQNSATATVSITVTHTNLAPTATSQSVTTAKNTSKAITLAGTDPENSNLTFSIVSNPSHGTLSGTVPNLTYLPANDYTGTDSFTFKVSDGTLDSATATVSITISQ